MLQESPFVQVGITEPGHKGGHDESGHSSSSIISKTLARSSFITPADPNASNDETYSIPDSPDPNVSDQDTDSIIDSVESLPDSDYGGDPMDADEQDPMDFIREVYAVVEGAIQTNNLDGVIDIIDSLRELHDMSDGDCLDHMFYCMMKSALEAPYDSVEFNKHIEEMLSNWKDVLTYFIYCKLSELDLIRTLEMVCSEIPTSFSPFLKILTCLYENGIVCKHAILYWAYMVGRGYGLDDTFVNQSSELIKACCSIASLIRSVLAEIRNRSIHWPKQLHWGGSADVNGRATQPRGSRTLFLSGDRGGRAIHGTGDQLCRPRLRRNGGSTVFVLWASIQYLRFRRNLFCAG